MAAPYSDLQSKCEAALEAEVEQVSLTNRGQADAVRGFNTNAELACPVIVCTAEQGEEDPPESGNYWLDCTVEIWSMKNEDATCAAHRSRLKYVADRFAVDMDTLRTNLSGRVSDFTCFGIKDRGIVPQRTEDKHVISGIRFRALCCPQDIS